MTLLHRGDRGTHSSFVIRHPSFVILSSFVIRHSSFHPGN
jgi:hypothetical protein